MANFRVTYATLSADNEELHAAFEEGVKTARAWVGETIPTVVDGEARTDGEPFTLHSPNDANLELATVHSATERDVDDAVAAAQAAFRCLVGHALAGAGGAAAPGRRPDQRALQRAGRPDGHGGRQEPAGGPRRRRGVGRPDPLLLPAAGRQRRLRPQDGPAVGQRAHPLGAQAVRRVGGHQPVQLPHGAGRRAGRGRPGRRQHRRPQAVPPGLVHRLQAVRVPARRRPARRACSTSCPAGTRSASWSWPPRASTASPSPAATRSA